MTMRWTQTARAALGAVALLSAGLGGCILTPGVQTGAYAPAYGEVYGGPVSYGYTTTAVPGTVYYAGGYYGGVYYRPGYYTARAPFVSVYGQPTAYAAPVAPVVQGAVGGSMVIQGRRGRAVIIAQPVQ
jgi:hypothetical protein